MAFVSTRMIDLLADWTVTLGFSWRSWSLASTEGGIHFLTVIKGNIIEGKVASAFSFYRGWH